MIGQHEYGDSFTGMLCGTMVTDDEGFGDQCGLPSEHPVHEGSLRRAITYAIGYEPTRVSLAPGVGGLTHRTAQDRDELVQRIGDKLDYYVIETQALALLEAAQRIQALHPGETKASVKFLRELADELSGSIE